MKIIILILAFISSLSAAQAASRQAEFAMGCFWCAEHDFEKVEGVTDVVSGYEGGTKETANYEAVSSHKTGHYETVQVTYDPEKVSYERLLDVFWDNIDPFDAEGQFCDKGKQYSAIVFVKDDAEKALADNRLEALQARHGDRVVTVKILPAAPFYPAEAYHQDFAKNNAIRYGLYRSGCGRDTKLQELRGQNTAP